MKKIIVLLSLVVMMISCNNVFDMYDGEDKFLLEHYAYNYNRPSEWVLNITPSENEKIYQFYEGIILKVEIRLYTNTGNRYDWYSEYTYY